MKYLFMLSICSLSLTLYTSDTMQLLEIKKNSILPMPLLYLVNEYVGFNSIKITHQKESQLPPSFVDNIQASKDYEIIPRKNIELQNVTEIRNKNNGAIVTLKGTHSDENDYLYTSLSSNGYFAATLCHGKSSKKVDFPHTLKLWNAVIGKELLSQKLSQKMLLAPLKSPIKINNSIPNKTEFAIESSDFYTYRSSLEFSDPSYIVYTINHFPLLPKNFFTEQKEK